MRTRVWNSSKLFEIKIKLRAQKKKRFYLFLRQPRVQCLSSPHFLSPFRWGYERPWELSLVCVLITLDLFFVFAMILLLRVCL
mgnify:CR=1 FL=1